MNHANIENSQCLQNMLEVLQRSEIVSGFALILAGPTTALTTRISELRANGYNIVCERRYNKAKKRQDHYYRLVDDTV